MRLNSWPHPQCLSIQVNIGWKPYMFAHVFPGGRKGLKTNNRTTKPKQCTVYCILFFMFASLFLNINFLLRCTAEYMMQDKTNILILCLTEYKNFGGFNTYAYFNFRSLHVCFKKILIKEVTCSSNSYITDIMQVTNLRLKSRIKNLGEHCHLALGSS